MSLNIKNQEAYRLAQAVARLTGESMTRAVTVALRERLDRVRRARKRKATAEALQVELKTRNPRARDKRFECEPLEADTSD